MDDEEQHDWSGRSAMTGSRYLVEQFLSPLLDQDQAGQYLRRNGRTLANWRVSGYGPPYIRIGRSAYYRVEQLDAWLAEQTHEHRAAETTGDRPKRRSNR